MKKATNQDATPGKKPSRRTSALRVISGGEGDGALAARWPDPVLSLPDEARSGRVRSSGTTMPPGYGGESVMLDDPEQPSERRTRGFVRAVLRVPLAHDRGSVYGVYVEVEREAYEQMRAAASTRKPVRVWGRLATRLPHLEETLGTRIAIVEDGGERRPRVVEAESDLLVHGPRVGPRDERDRHR